MNSPIHLWKYKIIASSKNNSGSLNASSSKSNEIHYDEELNVYYDSNGIVVDPDGKHQQAVGDRYSDLVDAKEKWERGELEMWLTCFKCCF